MSTQSGESQSPATKASRLPLLLIIGAVVVGCGFLGLCALGVLGFQLYSSMGSGPNTLGSRNPASGTLTITLVNEVVDIDVASGDQLVLYPGMFTYRAENGATVAIIEQGREADEYVEVRSAEGQPLWEIACSQYICDYPVLSPDGSLIAYYSDCTDECEGDYGGYTVIRNRQGEMISYFAGVIPTEWQDDRLVAYGAAPEEVGEIRGSDIEGIYMSDPELSALRRIDEDFPATSPRVSPDGGQIAFVLDNHIWLINTDGTDARQLTESGQGEIYPTWSPDGEWLMIQNPNDNSTGSYNSYRLYLVAVDSGEMTALTQEDEYEGSVNAEGPMTWR